MYSEMVKQPLFLFIFLIIIGENVLYTKEVPLGSENHEKPLQKHTPSYQQKRYEHHNLRTRCWPQRCSIFCPLVIIFPTNLNRTTLVGNNTTEKSLTTSASNKVTMTPSLLNATSTKLMTQNRRKSLKKLRNIHPTQRGRYYAILKISQEARDKLGTRKYTYHDLSLRQKHLLLKQLNLGNGHGKKAYEFKKISTSLCRVICQEENSEGSSTPSPERDSTDSEDSDEDTYEEGEDLPIEATIKPIVPPNVVIGGIRPFGGVDMIGLDDFGPNGELARDHR